MSRSRGKRSGPPQTDQRWLATYGDMVTLLMAFFVMLFAISSVEQEKFDAFISGLGQFDNPGKDPIVEAHPSAPVAPPVPDDTPVVAPPSPSPSPPPSPSLAPELEALGQAMLDAVSAAGHPGAIEITEDDRGLNVSIQTDRVLFDVGSARITRQGAEIIGAIAPPLAGVGHPVLLEGHADSTPLNRNGYTNWNLSTDRAVAVVNSLVDPHGLAPHRLTASGFGEFHPRDHGTDAAAKARNRRVELIVVQDDAP